MTMHSSCKSEDDSVIKVSASCSSVYVDGSESRGDLEAKILVEYGVWKGDITFTVWYPELPLTVEVDDDRLSLIKGWKVSSSESSGCE